MKKIFSLFAAVLVAGSMMATTVTKTVSDLATANSWTISSGNDIGTLATNFQLDEVVTISTSGEANCGSIWGTAPKNDWRLYQAKSGDIKIEVTSGYKLSSVTLTYTVDKGGVLKNGTSVLVSAQAVEVSAASVTFVVANSGSATNGQVRITQFSVTYAEDGAAVLDPTFSIAGGSFYEAQTVELSCATEGATIYYQTTGNWEDAVEYTGAITVSETTTIHAQAVKGADKSQEVTNAYVIAEQYASLTELVNAGAPANQKVVVTLEDVVIDSLYTSTSGNVNGVYVTAADRMVEIYCYNVPEGWEAGGSISGTLKGEWKEFNGTWEVCPSSWDGLTYTPDEPTAIDAVATERKAVKRIENGRVVIIRDGVRYNAVGTKF